MGFDSATTIVSASYYPSLSDSFWAIAKLRQILNSNTDPSRYIEFFKRPALNYLEAYIQKHLSKEQQEGMLVYLFQLIFLIYIYIYKLSFELILSDWMLLLGILR